MFCRGWARTMLVVGDAVEKGDWEDGELLEFCPHGERASLGVVF
jgi:hypothetical protein